MATRTYAYRVNCCGIYNMSLRCDVEIIGEPPPDSFPATSKNAIYCNILFQMLYEGGFEIVSVAVCHVGKKLDERFSKEGKYGEYENIFYELIVVANPPIVENGKDETTGLFSWVKRKLSNLIKN
ncbi:hypothetical protein [Helicobacter cetorum]|uniref:Uncharacterized protein n=1 Tax=Helicobacter cetorum (strain ATCC BAA-429 / MIT 00-7128) TaxID=182217 RepID=I0EL58_HELC0|nr:hypothetical protein [Helicobacter cetorum]AFI03677.1 hypothetical protein HCW_01960 [Helicobacter cetorum MIT 00-7128]